MKTKITKRLVDALPTPPAGKRVRVYDTKVTGFAAVKLPSGKVMFTLDYGPAKRRRRAVLAEYGQTKDKKTCEEARALAEVRLGEVRTGADPVAEKAILRTEPTFDAWRETYVLMVKGRKRSWVDDERYLSRAAGWWGSLRLSQITTEMVEKAFQQTRIDRGKISANRFLASVRASLQAAWRMGKVRENVAAKVQFGPENVPRARVLSADELQRVLHAVAQLVDPWERAAITLIIETGCRKSEALKSKWSDVDLDEGTWRIPSPKAGYPQVVPLARATVAMLRNLPRMGEWIFPGRHKGKRRADVRTLWDRIRKDAGVADATIHDLRRSFGLEVARTAGLHVASRLLRHSRISVTERVYAPLGIDELRKASEAVAKKRAKVLPMRSRKTQGGER